MHIYVDPGEARSRARSVGGFVTFGRFASSHGALLAGASLIFALTLGAAGQALAACGGTTVPTGAHAPSSGSGGVHAGATAPHASGSSGGGTSCSTTAIANPARLAGVHLPGEAPRHVSLAGVHPSTATHGTTNNVHSQIHPTTNRTVPKP